MRRNCGVKRSILSFACTTFLPIIARGQGHEIPPLRPPHGELDPTFWQQHGWQVLLAVAIFFVISVLFVLFLRRPRRVAIEPPAIVARRALEKHRNRPETGALVAEVSRVLKRYVMAAFQFPPEELTTTEFRKALRSHADINPELAVATADFLRRCDQWKFAPAPPTPHLGAVGGALELVEKMEASRAPVVVKT